ncbi:coiled-coil domain-containing protein 148-like, partial [Saccoglossus kowalevskii]|uniref:Coiled-coil domain-containing protein 148-like n=1 Tax=Saccoglossus kowalevskii TaxID=10224 RepID=A0ABM0GRE5_SACKO
VEFRVQILNEKRQERLEQLERQAEAEIEKEQRLQALRDQVKVNIDYDPVRMMQATESSKAKLGIGTDEDVIIQKPLFEIQGFTTDQVVSDPRHRLEEALRSANLHNNPYARQMITAAKPIKPPRKDTESTIFKIDQNESR